MNIHIELVKKWLTNPSSVTQEELEANAYAAYRAAYKADESAYEAAADAYCAAALAADAEAEMTANYVKRYEELTK